MAEYITQVMTNEGPKQIDYTALANLPTIDDMVAENSTNAVQGGAVYTELQTLRNTKLDAVNGKAADSEKLGNQLPSYYATAANVQKIAEELGLKLDGNIEDTAANLNQIQEALNARFNEQNQALDAAKLDGKEPSYYATAQAASDAQTTANNAMNIATQAKDTADTAVQKASFVLDGTTLIITIE